MLKGKKKKPFRLLYIFGTILVIALIGIFDKSLEDALHTMEGLNAFWFIMCFLCLFMFWISDAVLLSHITSYVYKKLPFLKILKISIIGLYYGALTPFATGGQPMQIVYMKKERVNYGTSTLIMAVKFLIYELSLCLFYVVAMIARGGFFYSNYNQVFWLTTLGFAINLGAVLLFFFTMINENLIYKLCNGFIRFLKKIRLIKNVEKALNNTNKNIGEFHNSMEYIKKHKGQVVVSTFLSILNLAFLFAIPYFIYLAFGHNQKTLVDIITLQSFLYLAVSFFPMPGAAGASEGGFYIFFSSVFTKVPVFVAMLVWRFMSYYSILITGSLLVVGDELLSLRRKKKSTETEDLK